MTSTEATVRAAVIALIEALDTSLGYASGQALVQPYLLEEEIDEKTVQYLMADIGAEKKARAWGVQVVRTEQPGSDLGTRAATYSITCEGYYKEEDGVVNTMLAHAALIRAAISGSRNISGTVDYITDCTAPVFGDVFDERVKNLRTINFIYSAEVQTAA